MDLVINSGHIYMGRGAGKPIMNSVRRGRRSIEVCSPYLSPRFVEELIKKQGEGVRVTLVTTNEFLKGEYGYRIGRNLVRQHRHTLEAGLVARKRTRYWGLMFLLAAAILAFAPYAEAVVGGWKWYAGAALCFACGMIALAKASKTTIYDYSYEPIFDFIVCNSWDPNYAPKNYLVHMKAYVVDREVAYLGSCNFSRSGFSFNHEFRLDITNKKEVEAVSKEIKRMRRDLECMSIATETLGRMFYKEPKF